MAKSTKQDIRDAFLRLLDERPLSQITVRDIVSECGVNRNTFYYYYQGLPQLMESIVNEAADQMIARYPAMESVDACLRAAGSFALENRRAVLHIYHSVNRDLYEQYQWLVCRHAAEVYLQGVLKNRRISENDREVLTEDLECTLFGFLMNWLEGGMEESTLARFGRICTLRRGALETMIARCEQGQ